MFCLNRAKVAHFDVYTLLSMILAKYSIYFTALNKLYE